MLDLGTSWTRRCRSGTSLGKIFPLDSGWSSSTQKTEENSRGIDTWDQLRCCLPEWKKGNLENSVWRKTLTSEKTSNCFKRSFQDELSTKQHSGFGTFGLLLLPELHVLGYLPIKTAIAGWALLHRPNYVPKLLSWLQGSCIPCDHEKTLISWVPGFISFRCCISRTFPLPHRTLCFLQWGGLRKGVKWRSVRICSGTGEAATNAWSIDLLDRHP